MMYEYITLGIILIIVFGVSLVLMYKDKKKEITDTTKRLEEIEDILEHSKSGKIDYKLGGWGLFCGYTEITIYKDFKKYTFTGLKMENYPTIRELPSGKIEVKPIFGNCYWLDLDNLTYIQINPKDIAEMSGEEKKSQKERVKNE